MPRGAPLNDSMTCPPNSLRIGGEFEFSRADYAGRAGADPAAKFSGRNCLWTDTGRSALLIAASAIRRRGGKPRTWLPAYSCESITQPFRQAGFEIQYYSGASPFARKGDALPQPGAGETLLFIHYFGHRNRAMAQAAQDYRAAGVWVIEDSVQGGLMPGLGNSGDFEVTSYRKLLPVMDGAALLSRSAVDLREIDLALEPPDETFVSARMLGKVLRGASTDAQDFLPLFEHSENRLLDRVIPRRMSWLSAWMMERLDWEAASTRRRANWLELSQRLAAAGLTDRLRPAFDSLREDEAPLGLPVAVAGAKRDGLRRFLADREIFCPVHWPLEHLPGGDAFLQERNLASSVLTLPVDQRMSSAHVGRLVEALNSYFSRT